MVFLTKLLFRDHQLLMPPSDKWCYEYIQFFCRASGAQTVHIQYVFGCTFGPLHYISFLIEVMALLWDPISKLCFFLSLLIGAWCLYIPIGVPHDGDIWKLGGILKPIQSRSHDILKLPSWHHQEPFDCRACRHCVQSFWRLETEVKTGARGKLRGLFNSIFRPI